MLWMPHVQSMRIEWPRQHRAEHIDSNENSAWMLLPNRPMVVLRRFSPKEDARRITAAPYLGHLPGSHVGLENHLNVFNEKRRGLPELLAYGLSVFMNSTAVDEAFRRFSGHTQVNATDLRLLQYPSVLELKALGSWAQEQGKLTQMSIDGSVAAAHASRG